MPELFQPAPPQSELPQSELPQPGQSRPEPSQPEPLVVTVGESMLLLAAPAGQTLRTSTQATLRVGGAESNTASGLARLGVAARWVSALGHDPPGERVLHEVRASGVDTRFVSRHAAPTGLYLREQTPNGAMTSYYRAGSAASRMSPETFPLAALDGATWLHLSGITPALSESCRALTLFLLDTAQARGLPVSYDVNFRSKLWTASQARAFTESCLPQLSVLLMSEDEAQHLWGHAGSRLLGELGQVGQTVVLKRGAAGSEMQSGDGQRACADAYPAAVIDTTGAGDAFNAGFLAARFAGLDDQVSLEWGNALGAWCVASAGDADALPSRAELIQFLSREQLLGR